MRPTRSLAAMTAISALALAACGGGDPAEKAAEDVASNAEVELPTYTEQTAVEPDIPGDGVPRRAPMP